MAMHLPLRLNPGIMQALICTVTVGLLVSACGGTTSVPPPLATVSPA